jgi:antitoxin component YwqK of YwqJK toxin-antitoxin module
MTSSEILECKAIPKSGERCKRNATIDGYCKQHYDKVESEWYNINNEGAISADVMKNVLSDYIEYDELKEMQKEINNLKVNQNRIREEKVNLYNGRYQIQTFVDGKVRHLKTYYRNGKIQSENNFDIDENLNGIQREWFSFGKLHSQGNYKHGKYYGLQEGWFPDGKLNYKKEYNENEELISSTVWDMDGNIILNE